jgi:hypothetical protein
MYMPEFFRDAVCSLARRDCRAAVEFFQLGKDEP